MSRRTQENSRDTGATGILDSPQRQNTGRQAPDTPEVHNMRANGYIPRGRMSNGAILYENDEGQQLVGSAAGARPRTDSARRPQSLAASPTYEEHKIVRGNQVEWTAKGHIDQFDAYGPGSAPAVIQQPGYGPTTPAAANRNFGDSDAAYNLRRIGMAAVYTTLFYIPLAFASPGHRVDYHDPETFVTSPKYGLEEVGQFIGHVITGLGHAMSVAGKL